MSIKPKNILIILLSATLLMSGTMVSANFNLFESDNQTISIEEKDNIVVMEDYTIFNGVDVRSNHVATIDED